MSSIEAQLGTKAGRDAMLYAACSQLASAEEKYQLLYGDKETARWLLRQAVTFCEENGIDWRAEIDKL